MSDQSLLHSLTAEAVQCSALPLQSVDDVHGRDGLPTSVLSIGDGVADHILQKDLEDPARLLVDQATDALDPSTAGEAADGRLGDALDVVPEDLAMTLSPALAQPFASLSPARHLSYVFLLTGLREGISRI